MEQTPLSTASVQIRDELEGSSRPFRVPPTPEPLTNKPYFDPNKTLTKSDTAPIRNEPNRSHSDLAFPRNQSYFYDKGAHSNGGIDNRSVGYRNS